MDITFLYPASTVGRDPPLVVLGWLGMGWNLRLHNSSGSAVSRIMREVTFLSWDMFRHDGAKKQRGEELAPPS